MKATRLLLMISMGGVLALDAMNAFADCPVVGRWYNCPASRGWYIEGNVGTSNQDNSNYGVGTSTSTKNGGLGLNANVGYKFFPYFALEGGYTRYSRIDIMYAGNVVAKNDPSTWDITTKAMLPIQDSGFSFYAKVGIGRTNSSITISNQAIIDANRLSISSGDTSSSGLLYGIGGEYYIWGNTAIHLSWVKVMGNNQTGDMEFTSVGLSYLIG